MKTKKKKKKDIFDDDDTKAEEDLKWKLTEHPQAELAFLTFYRNVPKFLDRQVWANSAVPDQTTPTGAV